MARDTTVRLLNDDDWAPTKEFERVLDIIFDRFDKDGDNLLSLKELKDYSRFTNGKEFSQGEIDDIQANLDCDEKGRLTRSGFHSLYWLQTSSDETETWRDLEKHGFDRSLRPVTGKVAGDEASQYHSSRDNPDTEKGAEEVDRQQGSGPDSDNNNAQN